MATKLSKNMILFACVSPLVRAGLGAERHEYSRNLLQNDPPIFVFEQKTFAAFIRMPSTAKLNSMLPAAPMVLNCLKAVEKDSSCSPKRRRTCWLLCQQPRRKSFLTEQCSHSPLECTSRILLSSILSSLVAKISQGQQTPE